MQEPNSGHDVYNFGRLVIATVGRTFFAYISPTFILILVGVRQSRGVLVEEHSGMLFSIEGSDEEACSVALC